MAGRAVLITGCSTGIGRATAQRLARSREWNVYATARRPESIADLTSSGCRTLRLDVTDEDSMKAAVAEVEARDGAVAVLVNNAGYGINGPVEEASMDDVRRQFETNVFGLARMCQLVLPAMRRHGVGRIVNVSSVGGRLTFPGHGFYNATKHAVESLSDALRFEVKPFGIDVIVVEPGTIKTRFGDTAVASIAVKDGPYASFNRELEKVVRGAYEGWMSIFAARPDAVAKVIQRALRTRRPRTRYRVTLGARTVIGIRRVTTDRIFDAFIGTQFPRPG
jgi:NAD(P)-dependent dehydrogenase (short-subunit alcohol dehydrogenase family)